MNFRPHEGMLKTLLDEPYKLRSTAISTSSRAVIRICRR